METLTKIGNIKNLYSQIEDKKAFRSAVAEEFNVAESTVRTGWFSRFEIPEKYNMQDSLIKFMQNYILINNSGGK
jgi:hypothetical protein